MKIKDMFTKKIDREIQGVIIVGQGEDANVSQELAKRNIRHSRVKNADGLEEKHYWSDKTKGIDDYLLSIRTATGGEGASA